MSVLASYLTVAPSLVVEPFLKSLKVVVFMVEANMSSEKVAVTLVDGTTPVALAVGTVLVTLGGWTSEALRCQVAEY